MNILTLSLTNQDGPLIRGITGVDDHWSVYDFVNVVCNKDIKDSYGRITFARLTHPTSENAKEVQSLCQYLRFPGVGQRDTPTMTLRGLQRLLMILGGKVAAEYRALVESTFTRVMAGDRSLIQVIQANAESTSPVQQAFRQALASEPADGGLERVSGVKRDRWNDLEYTKQRVGLIKDSTELYSQICADPHIDERARVFFKDTLMNQLLLENSSPTSVPLTISTVAAELGLNLSSTQLQSVGHDVATAYFVKNGKKPEKHQQMIGAALRPVNSYTQADRELVEAALKNFKGK